MTLEKIRTLTYKINKSTIWFVGIIVILMICLFLSLISIKYPDIVTDSLRSGDYRPVELLLTVPFFLFIALKKKEIRFLFIFTMAVCFIFLSYLIMHYAI